MVQTLSSLTFKGSIPEAIIEAKQQKKLFVVYVSGDNQDSDNLETSTWTDSNVADSVLKFCILLHISEGSIDASNFSTIYPLKSVPCITAIGYNGIQLWQHDGFVTADVLVTSIEKAWLSLHIQETTATFLTAALASKEQSASATSNNTLAEEGSSSVTNDIFSQSDTPSNPADIGHPLNSDMIHDRNSIESSGKELKSEIGEQVSPSSSANELENRVVPGETSCNENAELLVVPAGVNLNSKNAESHSQKENSDAGDPLSKVEEVAREIVIEANQCSVETNKGVVSPEVVGERNEILEVSRHENVVEKADVADLTANKSNDVHLNIRLPDGSSLQVKFSVMDNLKMVKAYLDENQASSFGSYSFAIPYPRKVFSEQDLDQSLLDLGLSGRQTLMVVLNRQANSHPKGGSLARGSNQEDGPSNGSNEGYWAYIRRVLSYMNPLSYLAGTSNSSEASQESHNSMWQYGPNPSLQDNLRAPGTYPSNPNATQSRRSDNGRRFNQSSSGFGSNIHTLRHGEDDDRFSDRNTYWNGNSTQFGGDNDGK